MNRTVLTIILNNDNLSFSISISLLLHLFSNIIYYILIAHTLLPHPFAMAEQIEEDKASWAEVQVTFILTAGTSAIFLGMFEIARRSPVISSVFDRRRNSKPHRTPPPLLSTSIFEWLFLSNEPRYSEYSDLSHMRDVIQERRRQRNPGRSGFFSSGRRNREDDGPTSDLDSPKDTNDYRVSNCTLYEINICAYSRGVIRFLNWIILA